jgi:RimJ/RimL family protein N-acetyltransferase
MKLLPETLTLAPVVLVPLKREMHTALTEVALACPEVFKHIPYRVASPADAAAVLNGAQSLQDAGMACCYVVRRLDVETPVGFTSIRMTEPQVPTLEIGGTWLTTAWQRTDTNTRAKRLLLAQCFEVFGAARVELKTDHANLASQRAIERLGATREGVLRSHMRRADGSLRDSVYYSVLKAEWLALRDVLDARLARAAP